MSAYISKAQLEARFGAAQVKAILDDDNDGVADADPLARVIADASSKVDSYLRHLYGRHMPFAVVPDEVVRLTLDVACGMLAERHPEYCRRDFTKALDRAEKDLMLLRTGKTSLGVVGVPEPAANSGALLLPYPGSATYADGTSPAPVVELSQGSSADLDPVTNPVFGKMGVF